MLDVKVVETDILVAGRGLAGLRAAATAAGRGLRVTAIGRDGGASREVMSLNAPVNSGDSEELFFQDTMRCGGINDPRLAKALCSNALDAVSYAESRGIAFDKAADSAYDVFLTLGSSVPRAAHSGSYIGQKLLCALKADCGANGVSMCGCSLIDVITDGDSVVGALCVDPIANEAVAFRCGALVMATGGMSGAIPFSTYPKYVSGDGYAAGYRAGAKLTDMEFLQFEPCTLVAPRALRGNILTTTLLAKGGGLYNALGEDFLARDGLRLNCLQKDELCLLIAKEIREGRGTGNGGVYFDATGLPEKFVREDHAIFYEPALRCGLDILKEPAEVAPAAHTCLGGLMIDENCATCVNGLFAAGEAAGGVHGQGRIGGSAGLEALVFGGIAGGSAADSALPKAGVGRERFEALVKALAASYPSLRGGDAGRYSGRLGEIAQEGLGLIRDEAGLQRCVMAIDETLDEACAKRAPESAAELLEMTRVRNAATVFRMQALASLARRESRGVFYRSDYRETHAGLAKSAVVWLENGSMRVEL